MNWLGCSNLSILGRSPLQDIARRCWASHSFQSLVPKCVPGSILDILNRTSSGTLLASFSSASAADAGPLPKPGLSKMPSFGEVAFEDHDMKPDGMGNKDLSLVQMYIAGCNHYWNMLPGLAEQSLAQGASEQEVWGAIRHLIVFAGYAPCLAATITLRQKGPMTGSVPGKVGGPPGNAFELVYDKVTDVVRGKLHSYDPVLAEYIRVHLYGDVYSSPGLTMAQKQLMTVAFLGEANMHDQLYTHLIAAMRFGNSRAACETAIKVGFHMSPRPSIVLRPILRGAMRSLEQAHLKALKQQEASGQPQGCPEVDVPDPASIRIPDLPPKTTT